MKELDLKDQRHQERKAQLEELGFTFDDMLGLWTHKRNYQMHWETVVHLKQIC